MTVHELRAEAVTLAYPGTRPVVDGLDLVVPPGRVTVIVGPNACGKSTLLRALARLMRPAEGQVVLDGHDIAGQRGRDVARVIGVLPQQPVPPEAITVAELVARGRHPHQRWFGGDRAEDDAAVAAALADTETLELADRPVDTLSGGQRQRVWIAMALAQQTDVLLLDEPTTFLDIAHQLDVLELLAGLNRERGTTIVAVLHELNLAGRFADHLVLMCDGRIVAQGPPSEVVTEASIEATFGLACRVVEDPVSGSPLVVPLGRSGRRVPHKLG